MVQGSLLSGRAYFSVNEVCWIAILLYEPFFQKLQQIEKLREQQAAGKQLELNQVRSSSNF